MLFLSAIARQSADCLAIRISRPIERKTDSHVGRCLPRNDGGGRETLWRICIMWKSDNDCTRNRRSMSNNAVIARQSADCRGNPHLPSYGERRNGFPRRRCAPPRNDGGRREALRQIKMGYCLMRANRLLYKVHKANQNGGKIYALHKKSYRRSDLGRRG